MILEKVQVLITSFFEIDEEIALYIFFSICAVAFLGFKLKC